MNAKDLFEWHIDKALRENEYGHISKRIIMEAYEKSQKLDAVNKNDLLADVSGSALKPIRQHLGGCFSNWYCPKCKKDITGKGYKNSCGECGQLLKW